MEHHETPSRRPRDASLARASLSPSRAAVIKSMQRSSKNQQARTILFTHTIGAFGHSAGTVPVSQEIPPNQPIGWIGRSIPIDRYRSMMTDPARVPPPPGVPTSRVCPARAGACARRRATSTRDGSTARGDVFIMVRAANANARARDVSIGVDDGGARRGTSRAMTTRDETRDDG